MFSGIPFVILCSGIMFAYVITFVGKVQGSSLQVLAKRVLDENIDLEQAFSGQEPIFFHTSKALKKSYESYKYLLPQLKPLQSSDFKTDFSVKSMAPLDNGNVAFAAENTIHVCNLEIPSLVYSLQGHSELVTSVVQLDNGNLVSTSYDQTIKIWDVRSEKCIQTLSGNEEFFLGIIQVADNKIASFSHNLSRHEVIKIWNLETGLLENSLVGHVGKITALTKINDRYFASAAYDGSIRIWDLLTSQCVCNLIVSCANVCSLIALDDDQLIAGTFDGSIILWNFKTGHQVLYVVHTEAITSLVKLESGKIASASSDKKIKIWNPMSANTPQTLFSHPDSADFLIKTKDGNLVSASSVGKLKRWTLFPLEMRRSFDDVPDEAVRKMVLLMQLEKNRKNGRLTNLHLSWVDVFKQLPESYQIMFDPYLLNDVALEQASGDLQESLCSFM